jgi:hypothetical protein
MYTVKFLIGAPGLGAERPYEIMVLKCVWVFSIMNHGRGMHGLGLYKIRVGLQAMTVIPEYPVHRLCIFYIVHNFTLMQYTCF